MLWTVSTPGILTGIFDSPFLETSLVICILSGFYSIYPISHKVFLFTASETHFVIAGSYSCC